MMEMFDRGITLRMGQCHVKRWIDDILPLVLDPADPLGTEDLATHLLPLDRGAPRLRDVPGQGRRLRQGDPPAVTSSTGKTVLVTGASSGIGRATALRLARRVPTSSWSPGPAEVLEQVRPECELAGGHALVAVADVATPSRWTAAFRAGHGTVRLGWTGSCTRPPRWPTAGSRTSPARSSTRSIADDAHRARPTSRARRWPSFRACGGGQPGRPGLAPGQDQHALHELLRHREVGRARAGAHPPDRGPQHARASTSAWSGPAAWTPPSTSRPAPTCAATAVRRRRSTRRKRWRASSCGPWAAAPREPRRGGQPPRRHRVPRRARGLRPHRHPADARRWPVPGRGRRTHPATCWRRNPTGEALHGRWGRHWMRPAALAGVAATDRS